MGPNVIRLPDAVIPPMPDWSDPVEVAQIRERARQVVLRDEERRKNSLARGLVGKRRRSPRTAPANA